MSENYPQLRATEAFQNLQAQLEGTENRISVERNNFNGAVQEYNTAIAAFPDQHAEQDVRLQGAAVLQRAAGIGEGAHGELWDLSAARPPAGGSSARLRDQRRHRRLRVARSPAPQRLRILQEQCAGGPEPCVLAPISLIRGAPGVAARSLAVCAARDDSCVRCRRVRWRRVVGVRARKLCRRSRPAILTTTPTSFRKRLRSGSTSSSRSSSARLRIRSWSPCFRKMETDSDHRGLHPAHCASLAGRPGG